MKALSNLFIGTVIIIAGCTSATNPDQLFNQKASLPQAFKLSELHQKVITTFISNREHTTSILYGNEKAYSAASAAKPVEATGQSFTLVTWQQQDDPHWFGARIPGDLISAETLLLSGTDDAPAYHYQKYTGKELVMLADTTEAGSRIKFILSQKASVTP